MSWISVGPCANVSPQWMTPLHLDMLCYLLFRYVTAGIMVSDFFDIDLHCTPLDAREQVCQMPVQGLELYIHIYI